ncbi:MAG: cytochrome b/b6 domain-containing protein [Pseudomonadota bacterium]
MTQARFSPAQRTLHWLTVAFILVMVTTGMMYFYEIGDRAAIQVHQIAGQLLIIVLVIRLIVRLRTRTPASDHAPLERALAGATHVALYAMLIAFVVTGYVSASALTNNALLLPVDRAFARGDLGERLLDAHYALKWVLLGLVGLHVAGALKHHFIDRDATLVAMWSGPRPSSPPSSKG